MQTKNILANVRSEASQKPLRIVAIIQARTGSTRLPNKVFEDIHGKPMLLRVVDRVRAAAKVNEVVVATSTSPNDAVIEPYCRKHSILSFRGSELVPRPLNSYRLSMVILAYNKECEKNAQRRPVGR